MPQKEPLLLIKLGGSLITDKKTPYTANFSAIQDIARVLKTSDQHMIIAHGSGSFGHTSAAKYGGMHGYTSSIGIATVAKDAMTINSIVIEECLRVGLPVMSFRPMSFLLAKDGELAHHFYLPIEQALCQSLIPVVYGDVIMDGAWKSTIFSGETTLNHLAIHFRDTYDIHVIELCDVPGVLDKSNTVISEITAKSWNEIKENSIRKTNHDVTGGMSHKVEAALALARHGIPTRILDGRDPHLLKQALIKNSTHGTIIHL